MSASSSSFPDFLGSASICLSSRSPSGPLIRCGLLVAVSSTDARRLFGLVGGVAFAFVSVDDGVPDRCGAVVCSEGSLRTNSGSTGEYGVGGVEFREDSPLLPAVVPSEEPSDFCCDDTELAG